ncbi:hypothetical protein F373_gp192 [Bacillus phage SP-10]|uniref:hypothetical protein n=1 Tax=Bacillus phage SP10 TaxID=941058 RepID=UPI0002198B94|nr:hypothetical protein F373_gp192 [Bacillus phage SP-10]BAK53004.1 hypothetical protein [Bacillus phage SP-10]
MKRKQNNLEPLKQKREGYIMVNEANNVEIKCTPEFKQIWLARGFKVVKHSRELRLI